ncbi:uncharacterized protein E0L32_003594 [Thyridium curvatum]|uniref:Uncharacterized protein n=1 Tax=Thyridium curvatum TaxID=1093900 RepID=A0A507BAT8_9PEZI|nr:uncharacterized protein E0L32_003594 [Thyridium curvatum]TPX16653.1 hypothetical protein E0L32_003594 [Thyridium curvatum]
MTAQEANKPAVVGPRAAELEPERAPGAPFPSDKTLWDMTTPYLEPIDASSDGIRRATATGDLLVILCQLSVSGGMGLEHLSTTSDGSHFFAVGIRLFRTDTFQLGKSCELARISRNGRAAEIFQFLHDTRAAKGPLPVVNHMASF